MARRKKIPRSVSPLLGENTALRWLLRIGAFLAGSGIFLALLSVTYQYFAGNVALEFVQAVGRGCELQFKNDTPSDKKIKTFRVVVPLPQRFVYKISEDVIAHINERGEVTLPGGNISYVPAAEFKELDGQILLSNSSLKFRLPPLSSRSWMQPEATIVDVQFELEPSNRVLAGLEVVFDRIGVRPLKRTIRYLVIENYWAPSNSTSLTEAIRVFCRDNDAMAKSSTCANER